MYIIDEVFRTASFQRRSLIKALDGRGGLGTVIGTCLLQQGEFFVAFQVWYSHVRCVCVRVAHAFRVAGVPCHFGRGGIIELPSKAGPRTDIYLIAPHDIESTSPASLLLEQRPGG